MNNQHRYYQQTYHHHDQEQEQPSIPSNGTGTGMSKIDHNHHYNMTTMTEAVFRAVSKNNDGTKLIQNCQYDEAVKAFMIVLKVLKPLAAIVENNKNNNANNKSKRKINTTSSSFSIRFASNHHVNGRTNDTIIDDVDDITTTTRTRTRIATSDMDGLTIDYSSPPSFDSLTSPVAAATTHYVFRDPVMILPESVPTPTFTSRGPTNTRSSNQLHTKVANTDEFDINNNNNEHKIENDDDFMSFMEVYTPELFSKFLLIVMFNLALTLQLHAQSLCNSNVTTSNSRVTDTKKNSTAGTIHKLFVRSRKLYELAFEMHLDMGDGSSGGITTSMIQAFNQTTMSTTTSIDDSDDDDNNKNSCKDDDVNSDLLFTLGLINNLGLVYCTLQETVRCQTCFQNMFSTMLYLTDTNRDTNRSQSRSAIKIKDDYWDGLLSNVMNLIYKPEYEVVALAA